jgi:hypothetical protein
MITGSNTNIRHGGRLFHVQTEDSGRRNPHVISHLYSAGTILASEKTDYSDRLDLESETLAKDVRALIEEQHKEMLRRLKRGDYDAVIAQRIGGDSPGSSGTEPTPPAVTPPDPGLAPEPEPEPEPTPAPSPAAAASAESAAAGSSRAPRGFGDGIVSQKPLDEVILEYLVEKSRSSGPDRGRPPAERPRKKE